MHETTPAVGSLMATGEALSVQGKITIGATLPAKGEYADLRFSLQREETQTSKLRVHFKGQPAVSVYATPPAISFGRVCEGRGGTTKEIEVFADAAVDDLEAVEVTGLPVAVRRVPGLDPKAQKLETTIRGDGLAKSSRVGKITFRSRANPALSLDVPMFVEIVPEWRCDPPTVVLCKDRTAADVSVIAFDPSQGSGIASARIVGLAGLRVVAAAGEVSSVRIDDFASAEKGLHECLLEFEANRESHRAPLAVIVRD